MPVIPKPVITITIHMLNYVDPFSVTLYYEPTGASTYTQGNLDSIAASVAGTIGPDIRAMLSEQASVTSYNFRLRTPTQDLETFITEGDGIGEGSVSGECFPTEVCLEMQRRTGKPGRHMRGRIFWSGISEEAGSAGRVKQTDTTHDAAQVLAASLATDLTSGAFTLHARHWNRKTNTLEVVTQMRPMTIFVSRRDRQSRRQIQPF